jgi:hypothetical protein
MKRLAVSLVVALGAALPMSACRQPTQAQVDAYTNVTFVESAKIAFFTGRSVGDLSRQPAVTPEVAWGQDGIIGSIVFVPPEGNTGPRLAVRAVLAFGRDPASCFEGDHKGCIVADREVPYLDNAAQRIPIGLFRQCDGIVCAQGATCNYQGQCVPAQLDPAQCGGAGGCVLPGDPPTPTGVEPVVVPQVPPAPPKDAEAPPPDVTPPLPPRLEMVDLDPRPRFVSGALNVRTDGLSLPIARVELFFRKSDGSLIVPPFASPTALPGAHVFPGNLELPATVEEVSAVSVRVNAAGREIRSEATVLNIDNYARLRDLGGAPDSVVGGLDAALDLAGGRLLVAMDNAKDHSPGVITCALDGTGCKSVVIGPANTGYHPALLFDQAMGTIDVIADDRATVDHFVATIHACDGQGLNCKSTRLSTLAEGELPGRSLAHRIGGKLRIYRSETDGGVQSIECGSRGDTCTEPAVLPGVFPPNSTAALSDGIQNYSFLQYSYGIEECSPADSCTLVTLPDDVESVLSASRENNNLTSIVLFEPFLETRIGVVQCLIGGDCGEPQQLVFPPSFALADLDEGTAQTVVDPKGNRYVAVTSSVTPLTLFRCTATACELVRELGVVAPSFRLLMDTKNNRVVLVFRNSVARPAALVMGLY